MEKAGKFICITLKGYYIYMQHKPVDIKVILM